MAETRFIKAVPFCGYDKADVDKRLELLYEQIYELKNELREAKLVMKKYEEGANSEKAFESALANERAMLTQLQVKNESLSEKNKALLDDNKAKEKEIAEMTEKLSALTAQAEDDKRTIASLKSTNNAEMLGLIFVEAQKSSDLLISTAQKQADTIQSTSKQFAEDMIVDANNKASKIIYDAEREAAEIIADAKNSSESMIVSSGNLRTVMLSDISKMSEAFATVKSIIKDFEDTGLSILGNAEQLLGSAEEELKSGGVPVFKEPEVYSPQYPAEPIYATLPSKLAQEKELDEKKASELNKLQAMAEAIGKEDKPSGPDLGSLLDQAKSLADSDTPAPAEKKKGPNLADLAKQAAALGS